MSVFMKDGATIVDQKLVMLWSIAGILLAVGFLLTFRSLSGIPRTVDLWNRKQADTGSLQALQTVSARHKSILASYARLPATSARLESIVQAAIPSSGMSIRNTEIQPAIAGWIPKKVSVGFTDLAGDDLGKLLDGGASAQPPWTLLECTLFASPTPGRLAKAELVMGTVERQSGE